jgi:NTP pyrophosphatase (non-canonical NTP hydrolase)
VSNVIGWADDKNLIDKEKSTKQMLKVMEEVGETASALAKGDRDELIDGIGDVFVTLIILAAQNGLKPEDCLQSAWDEIKNRTGKTVNGVFIKD